MKKATQKYIEHYYQGIQLFKAAKDDEAKQFFEQCVQEAPDVDFYVYSSYVYLLKILHEAKEFEHLLVQMKQYNEDFSEIEQIPALWVLRGVWAKANLEYEVAIECFLKAIHMVDEPEIIAFNLVLDEADTTWKPRLGLAEIYLAQDRFEDAYPMFKYVLQTLPDNEYILSGFMISAFRSGHYRELLPFLEKLKGLSFIHDDLKDAFEVTLLVSSKQIKQAYSLDIEAISNQLWTNLENILSIDEFSIICVMEFAFSLLHINLIEQSRKFILRLLELTPNHVLLWHNLAYSYFKEKDYKKAEQYYQEALNASPLFVYSRFDLAKVYVMQEKLAKAKSEFEQVLEYEPDFVPAEAALKQLKEMM